MMHIGRTLKGMLNSRRAKLRPPSEAELCLQRAARNHEAVLGEQNRSILFFTVHKCASTFTSRFLKELGDRSNLRHVDYSKIIYNAGDDLDVGNMDKFLGDCGDMLFSAFGDVYGPLRAPIEFSGIENYRKVFFLRDPRDVLVSAYYSLGFSHGVPKNSKTAETFLTRRAKIREEGIDRYCMSAAEEWIVPVYKEYQFIRDTSGGLFLSYRDFVDHPADFADRLLGFVDLPDDAARERIRAFIVNEEKITPNSPAPGNPTTELSHQRSGRHGQYQKELQPETILAINAVLAEQLNYWGFDAEPTS